MEEKWKQIANFENYYVSNKGKVIEKNYKSRKKLSNITKEVKNYVKENGYLQVNLYSKKEKKSYKKYLHRLVAEAFIPNPNDYPCVNHLDGNKTNNNINNLEWCTYSQNMVHAVKNNLFPIKFGKNNKNSKKYVELDINYDFIRTFIGSREENKKLGYTRDTIEKCARGNVLNTHNKIYLFYEDYYENDISKTKFMHYEKHRKYLKKRRKK